MAVWRQCRSQLKTERDKRGHFEARDSISYSAKSLNHQLIVYLTDFDHNSSWKTLCQVCICKHYLFLAEAVVSAVAVVLSVGANEISEGLLAREEIPC